MQVNECEWVGGWVSVLEQLMHISFSNGVAHLWVSCRYVMITRSHLLLSVIPKKHTPHKHTHCLSCHVFFHFTNNKTSVVSFLFDCIIIISRSSQENRFFWFSCTLYFLFKFFLNYYFLYSSLHKQNKTYTQNISVSRY